MGAVISFFRLVGTFIISIPQNIVCIFKLILFGGLRKIADISPILWFLVGVVNVWPYLWGVLTRFVMFLLYLVVGVVLWIIDRIVSDVLQLETSLGTRVRALAVVLSACENDPRSWYTRAQWHRGNRYARLFGLPVCMLPCSSAYAPGAGALLAFRMPGSVPRRCPRAHVTLAHESPSAITGAGDTWKLALSHARAGDLLEYRDKCAAVKLTEAQRALPEAICSQAASSVGTIMSRDVSGMCYEMLCARGVDAKAPDAARPSFCSKLVTTGIESVRRSLYGVPWILAMAACAVGIAQFRSRYGK
jgi:hypothetical protein